MSAVLQNEDRVLPAELTVEISGKALLLSAGVDQTQGMLPFSWSAVSIASVAADFRGWILTWEPDLALLLFVPLLRWLKYGMCSQPSLSVKCKNKQQQKLLELNSWKQVRQSHVNHQNQALQDPRVFFSLSSVSFQAPPPAE